MGIQIIMALLTINSAQFNLPKNLLASICYTESTYNVSAVHHDDGGSDSLGLCQIKLETAKEFGFKGTQRQLMNPYWNTYYAAKYLHHEILRYHGVIVKAVIAYNRGSAGNLIRTEYSNRVLARWRLQK